MPMKSYSAAGYGECTWNGDGGVSMEVSAVRVFRDDGEIATDYPMSNFVGLNAAVYDDDGDYEVQHPPRDHTHLPYLATTFLIWQPPSSFGRCDAAAGAPARRRQNVYMAVCDAPV